MPSFNKVILVGNMTRDPEMKYTQGGTAVCEVGLAVNDRVKQNEEWVDEVTFVDITYFGRIAEVIGEYLRKGSPMLCEGRLKLDQWKDKQTGANRYKLKVIGNSMQMLGNKDDSRPASTESANSQYSEPVTNEPVPVTADDNIPF